MGSAAMRAVSTSSIEVLRLRLGYLVNWLAVNLPNLNNSYCLLEKSRYKRKKFKKSARN